MGSTRDEKEAAEPGATGPIRGGAELSTDAAVGGAGSLRVMSEVINLAGIDSRLARRSELICQLSADSRLIYRDW